MSHNSRKASHNKRASAGLVPGPAACPCGSGQAYQACCEPLHTGGVAATAEALMRSRYAAYVLMLEDYLLATWHEDTRPPALDSLSTPQPQWLRLQIKDHSETGTDTAHVEFIAAYKLGGKAHRLHEVSRFLKRDGRWYYVDGVFPEADALA